MIKAIPNLRLFLTLLFLSLLIFSLDSLHFLDFIKRPLFYVTNPISFGLYSTRQQIGRQFEFIFEARQAARENKALKEQMGDLLSENALLRKKLAETEALVAQEQYLDPKIYNLIPARPTGLFRYLRIDKGEDDGIKAGQAVVFKDNFIGKVVEISAQAANIRLLSDPDSKVAAFSQGLSGKARGVLVGQFGTDFLFDKILHEEQIQVGDLVYSEGTEGYLPRGLILGRVKQVMERENEVFKQAKVEPVFSLRDLDLVFVMGDL
ncbi:rod shape-determining protein MreC [Candidatus Daviesbacteria bacterium]|nr:rod shape-determining protein MreC [Candidatus Daviesbacteria bacterium]